VQFLVKHQTISILGQRGDEVSGPWGSVARPQLVKLGVALTDGTAFNRMGCERCEPTVVTSKLVLSISATRAALT
jgi:hypothetical protein